MSLSSLRELLMQFIEWIALYGLFKQADVTQNKQIKIKKKIIMSSHIGSYQSFFYDEYPRCAGSSNKFVSAHNYCILGDVSHGNTCVKHSMDKTKFNSQSWKMLRSLQNG